MIAHNFPAQQFIQIVLQGWQALREFFQLCEVNRTDLAVLQRIRSTRVLIDTDGVEPEHFAGNMKTGHLLAAVDGDHAGLERAYSHGVQRA